MHTVQSLSYHPSQSFNPYVGYEAAALCTQAVTVCTQAAALSRMLPTPYPPPGAVGSLCRASEHRGPSTARHSARAAAHLHRGAHGARGAGEGLVSRDPRPMVILYARVDTGRLFVFCLSLFLLPSSLPHNRAPCMPPWFVWGCCLSAGLESPTHGVLTWSCRGTWAWVGTCSSTQLSQTRHRATGGALDARPSSAASSRVAAARRALDTTRKSGAEEKYGPLAAGVLPGASGLESSRAHRRPLLVTGLQATSAPSG